MRRVAGVERHAHGGQRGREQRPTRPPSSSRRATSRRTKKAESRLAATFACPVLVGELRDRRLDGAPGGGGRRGRRARSGRARRRTRPRRRRGGSCRRRPARRRRRRSRSRRRGVDRRGVAAAVDEDDVRAGGGERAGDGRPGGPVGAGEQGDPAVEAAGVGGEQVLGGRGEESCLRGPPEALRFPEQRSAVVPPPVVAGGCLNRASCGSSSPSPRSATSPVPPTGCTSRSRRSPSPWRSSSASSA